MSVTIEFQTDQIDTSGEPENPINPIKGYSLGSWLAPLLQERGITTSEIETENWGWYFEAALAD